MSKQIIINDDLYHAFAERAKGTAFKTVDAYVEYVLQQVIKKLKTQPSASGTVSDKGEQKVKQRLKDLGYLE